MLASIAIALAFAGAPAAPTTCQPVALIGDVALGRTYWSTLTTPERIELAAPACGGMLLLQMNGRTRRVVEKLNHINALQWIGRGALTTLHEASHYALPSRDECVVEKRALALVPEFLSRYLSGIVLERAVSFARQYDASLPASYRAC